MEFSTVPFLFLGLVSFIAINTVNAKRRNAINTRQTNAIYALLFALVAWCVFTGYLSASGFYRSTLFLSFLPGLWLPLVPIIISICAVVISLNLRSGISELIDNTPKKYFVYVHAFRILAIGSIWKAYAGDFPVNFAVYVGMPDLLFGVSAIYVGLKQHLSEKFLMLWNLFGALVVTIPAMFLFQTGLPGPMQLFTDQPTTEKLLEFPMVLAPSSVVPMFILLNMMVFLRIYRGRLNGYQGTSTSDKNRRG